MSTYFLDCIAYCNTMFPMNRLSTSKRTQVIGALAEGVSINVTCRLTGVAKHTVLKLLKDLGCACAEYHLDESRYSPATCIGCRTATIIGNPDPKHISTSYVERQNLTMRMGMRRFTRLTNGFSKKVENHGHAVALHFMYYNFCHIHKTLRVTPAMEAGLTDHPWDLNELVSLLESPVNTGVSDKQL